MKAAARKSLRNTSSAGDVELLLAELRAGRNRLQHLVRLVNEEAQWEYGAMRGIHAARTLPGSAVGRRRQ